jgi:polysaccharide export outer membrane protein
MLLAVVVMAGQVMAQGAESKPALKKPEKRSEQRRQAAPLGEEQQKGLGEDERQALRREDQSEAEAAVMPYINNYFETFRLGPEDVITVDVFGQEKYSRSNITVPPDGRISYPLIGQIKVVGRTTTEVEREITEKLSEYIIEPKVTVQLVQSHSQKIFIVGDVGAPGIYEMTRRMNVTEALARAGYITRTGDRSGVRVLRMRPDGQVMAMAVNMKEIERGRGQDLFLVPGDTVVVPGNRLKKVEQIMGLFSLGAWMRTVVR